MAGELLKFILLGMIGFLAGGAKGADQPLRQHAQQGIGEGEGVDPHVQEPDDRLRRVVRVQRGEDQMARGGGVHAHLRRLVIPHLAHHDDIGIGPEKGAHGVAEIETDLVVDLNLTDPLLGDLHGILHRPDLDVGTVEHVQGGMGRGGLSRTGGTHEQDQAVRFFQDRLEPLQGLRRHLEFIEDQDFPPREDPQNHVLHIALGGNGGHPQFDLSGVRDFVFDLPVLGKPPFGDIEVGHDLDPRDDGGTVFVGKTLEEDALPVDPETDVHQIVPDIGFEMDVRRPAQIRLVDHVIDQLDDIVVRFGDGRVILPVAMVFA